MNKILIFLILTLAGINRLIDQPPPEPAMVPYHQVSNTNLRQFTANYYTDEVTGRSGFLNRPIQFRITFNSDSMIITRSGRNQIALKSDTMGSEFADSLTTYRVDYRSVIIITPSGMYRLYQKSMI